MEANLFEQLSGPYKVMYEAIFRDVKDIEQLKELIQTLFDLYYPDRIEVQYQKEMNRK